MRGGHSSGRQWPSQLHAGAPRPRFLTQGAAPRPPPPQPPTPGPGSHPGAPRPPGPRAAGLFPALAGPHPVTSGPASCLCGRFVASWWSARARPSAEPPPRDWLPSQPSLVRANLALALPKRTIFFLKAPSPSMGGFASPTPPRGPPPPREGGPHPRAPTFCAEPLQSTIAFATPALPSPALWRPRRKGTGEVAPFFFLLTEKGPRRDWRAEAWWGRVGRAPNLFTQTAHGGHPRSLLTPTPQPVSTACQASTCLIAFNLHKHFVK